MKVIKEIPSIDVATQLAAAGFCCQVSPELRHDVETHLGGGQTRVVKNRTEQGFVIFRQIEDILYLSGIILAPEVQGKGFAGQIIVELAHDLDAKYLALRTQNIRMWRVGAKICSEWYPNYSQDISSEMRYRGDKLANAIGCDCFPLVVGCYGRPLYGQKPTHRDQHLQGWWDSICDFYRGDAIICFGKL